MTSWDRQLDFKITDPATLTFPGFLVLLNLQWILTTGGGANRQNLNQTELATMALQTFTFDEITDYLADDMADDPTWCHGFVAGLWASGKINDVVFNDLLEWVNNLSN
jgi:hypothetical protein